MTGTLAKIRTRICSMEIDAWNHPRLAILMAPVFVLVGGGIGIVAQTILAHYGYIVALNGVFTLVMILLTLVTGYAILAIFD